jgi:hypothetical protein
MGPQVIVDARTALAAGEALKLTVVSVRREKTQRLTRNELARSPFL